MGQLTCPELIGRESERGVIAAALDAARAGNGRTVFLLGEAGAGKSRLMRDVTAADGVTVLQGRAVQSGSPVAFRPLAEALMGALRRMGLPDVPSVEPFRPALGRVVAEWRDAGGGTDGSGESLVVVAEGVLRLLCAVGTTGASLLLLEDLQWADAETLAIAEYLADNLAAEPVMLLAAVRTPEWSPALALARSLAARRAAQVVELPRLADAAVEDMVRACLEVDETPAALDALIRAKADGLPLLVEELLAGLADRRVLLPRTGGWDFREAPELIVPATVADAVRGRLSHLGENARAVLAAAAILGRRFDWALLPGVTGLAEDAVLAALRQAVEAQLLVTEPGTTETDAAEATFAFRHALTRDAILAGLLPPEQTALARQGLAAVEASHPALPGGWCHLAVELAVRAGLRTRAGALLVTSARRAAANGALSSAESALDRARALAGDDIGLIAEAEEVLCEVLALAGKSLRALALGPTLLAKLSALGAPPARRCEVHLRLARAALAGGQWLVAAEHLEHARRAAADDAEAGRDLLARADALAAHVALGRRAPDDAVALARRALDAAEAAALPVVACEALEVLGRCARLRDPGEAAAAFIRAQAIAEQHRLVPWRIKALQELGTLDLMETLRDDRLLAARQAALDAGALATAAVVDLYLAAVYNNRFDQNAALEAARRCAAAARRFRLPVLPMALVTEAIAHAHRGEREAMEAAIEQAIRLAPDDLDVQGGCSGASRAMLSLFDEDLERALAELGRGMAYMRQSPTTNSYPFRGLWALLVTLHGDGGEAARAEVAGSGVTAMRRNRVYLGFAEAVALGRSGRREAAEQRFAAADAEAQVLEGSDWFRRHAHRLVAEAALADHWGDPVGWLRAALPCFRDSGHRRIAAACQRLLRGAGAPVPRRGRGAAEVPAELRAAGVTSREADVLELLVAGLSNREIAASLYLSPRTVEKHVASLLAKTGAATRSQLAVHAAGSQVG